MDKAQVAALIKQEVPDLEIITQQSQFNAMSDTTAVDAVNIPLTTGPSIEALREKYLGRVSAETAVAADSVGIDNEDDLSVQVLKQRRASRQDGVDDHTRTVIVSAQRGIVASQG